MLKLEGIHVYYSGISGSSSFNLIVIAFEISKFVSIIITSFEIIVIILIKDEIRKAYPPR